MRSLIVATAALAAATLACAPALATQMRAEALQSFCPDMTRNEIAQNLAVLVEQYEFSSDIDEAELQAAGLICQYAEDAAEAQMTQAMVVLPPPHRDYRRMPPPRRMQPPPPKPRMGMPHRAPPRMMAPPPRMASQSRMPPAVYFDERGKRSGYREKPRSLKRKSVRGPAYCLAVRDGEEAYEAKYPMPEGYADGACTIGKIPGEPCPGWVCTRG